MVNFDKADAHVKKGNRATRSVWGDAYIVASGIGRKDIAFVSGGVSRLWQPEYEDATGTDWVLL